MVEDRNDLMLKMLRDIREDTSFLRACSEEHSEQIRILRKEMQDLRETIPTCGESYAVVRPRACELDPSLRAEGEAIQGPPVTPGLLRRSAPRNDVPRRRRRGPPLDELWTKFEALSPEDRQKSMDYTERALGRLAKCKKAKSI